MIHKKELFMLDANNQPVKVHEDGYVPSQKNNSRVGPSLLPLSVYKNAEDEE